LNPAQRIVHLLLDFERNSKNDSPHRNEKYLAQSSFEVQSASVAVPKNGNSKRATRAGRGKEGSTDKVLPLFNA